LYAFSTENWSRPEEEKNYLFKLPAIFFQKYIEELKKENIRVTYIGEIDAFPENTRKVILDATQQTSMNTGLNLCLAVNYGGRREIVWAVNQLLEDVKKNQLDHVDEDTFASYLMSENKDVDLLIRTSGEIRVSNFMLWQIAYAEMIFVSCAWPDFDEKEFDNCIEQFNKRNRRFGGLK
ncbi:MAG: polyprenyl diphosphate synthase, partial [Traorella sp.]